MLVLVCDRCHQPITDNGRVRIEFIENGTRIFKDYHVDCFNYEFSTDIRKIAEEQKDGDR